MPRSRRRAEAALPPPAFEELVLALEAAAEIAEITLGSGSRKAVGHAVFCLIEQAKALTAAWREAGPERR